MANEIETINGGFPLEPDQGDVLLTRRAGSTTDWNNAVSVTLEAADAGPDATIDFTPSSSSAGVFNLVAKSGLPFTQGVPQPITFTLDETPAPPPDPVSGLFLNTNIRHNKIIGTRAAYGLWNNDANYAANQIVSSGLQYIIDNVNASAFSGNVSPGLILKMSWRTCVINKNLKPTNSAQARDPDWSNYSWNNADPEIANWLTNQITAANAQGIELGVMIADQATAANNTVPEWVLDEGSAWVEDATVADWARQVHLRQDLPGVMEYYADFVVAFMAKFAPENLWGLIFAEYYAGPVGRPAAVQNNRDLFYQNRKILWETANTFMPIREDGSRLALYQTNPVIDGAGIDQNDLHTNLVGVSQSDVKLFTSNDFMIAAEGIVPVVANNDSRYARLEVNQTWPTPVPLNPFGITAGQYLVATPQHIMYNSAYRVKMDSIFFNVEASTVQTKESIVDAINKFGPGGTLTGTYGITPTGGTS